jgi:sugar lactone lactonase YvrE
MENGTLICQDFTFIEGPRWHEGALWFSDFYDKAVFRVVPGERPEKVVSVPQQPSGLGWLPNGDLLVSSMLDKTLYRWSETEGLNKYADVSAVAERRINDMLVEPGGRAWVGNFGFVHQDGESIAPGTLARVDTDRSVHAAAGNLLFANGMVLVNGGNTLIVAETYRGCLTAFDIESTGHLVNRRLWAQLPEGDVPDGICVDAEEAIWVASPTTGSVLRLLEGGEVTDSSQIGRKAIACALGGNNGRTLFVSSAESTDRDICLDRRSASIEAFEVTIASAK